MLDVFCYGEIGVDNIIQVDRIPSPEDAVFPITDTYHIGGAAANTAVWLANFGVRVGLSGNAIGKDLYGEQLWDWLSQYADLDLSLVERKENDPTPFTRALVTPDGERSFLIYWYPKSHKTPFQSGMLNGARYLALDMYGGKERQEAAQIARKEGVQTFIGDVIAPGHPVLPFTSVATNSASFIRNTYPGIDVHQNAHQVHEVSKGIVITTDGPDPVYVLDQEGHSFCVAPPQVACVDATGAGDAFRAGVIYAMTQGFDLPKCICWGVATGSLKIRNLGAASILPTISEIKNLAGTLKIVPL
jgi:sugar/nucleoside kinase (ribokinase family)